MIQSLFYLDLPGLVNPIDNNILCAQCRVVKHHQITARLQA